MSKLDHDAHAANMRAEKSSFNKPWYLSSMRALKKYKLRDLRCLDLCAGNCEFAVLMRDQLNMDVVCADYIPTQLQKAKDLKFETLTIDLDSSADEVGKNIEKHVADFDLVVSIATIEHIFNSDNLLSVAHSVLKPGGVLLVNTPNIGYAGYRFYAALNGNRPFGDGHHVRFWEYRFLRTNLFLNGFDIVMDGRSFHSLPIDPLTRALKGRERLANIVARLFFSFFALQHLPFWKGLFTDELTLLCRRSKAPAVGFELPTVERNLDRFRSNAEVYNKALRRLKTASEKGWLNEHLYLNKLVKSLVGGL